MALSEKRKASMYKYARENLKRVPLDVPKEHYETIKDHAAARGETVNGFIKRAITETIERDRAAEVEAVEAAENGGGAAEGDAESVKGEE